MKISSDLEFDLKGVIEDQIGDVFDSIYLRLNNNSVLYTNIFIYHHFSLDKNIGISAEKKWPESRSQEVFNFVSLSAG